MTDPSPSHRDILRHATWKYTFWFDQIPSSNVPLENSTVSVSVDSSDRAVKYSSGWAELDEIVNVTQNAV